MNRLGFLHWLSIIAIMTIGVVGCTIERRNGGAGDIEEFSPPVVSLAQQTVAPTTVITTTPTLESTVVTTTTPTLEPTIVTTITTPTLEPTTVTTATPTLEPTIVITMTPTPEPTLPPTVTPIPPPTSIPAPPGATIGVCYRVQPGETIYSLAQVQGTSPYAINLANDLYPPNLLYAYQTLFIPRELGRGPNVYIIEAGDTLAGIAEKCKLPESMIAGVNGMDPNTALRAGDALIIPIPPFPPPARFNYPTGPLPLVPYPPRCCNAYPPYRPGPPIHR